MLAVLSALCLVLVGAHPDDEEEVTASKIQLRDWFPTAYSVLSLRQYNEAIHDAKDPTGVLQLRYSLGSKFFDERLDTSLTLAVNKRYETKRVEDSDTISQRLPEFFASYELIDHELLEIKPYTVVNLPIDDKSLAVSVGSTIQTNYDMDVAGGKVSIGGGADLWLTQSEYGETEVRVGKDADRTSLIKHPKMSLRGEGEGEEEGYTIEEDYTRFGSDYGIWASYEPGMIDGLTVGLSSVYRVRYTPEFEANADNKPERRGYNNDDKVESSVSVSYNVTDDLSISNDFYYYVDGFFNKATDSGELRSLNRIRISYTLF